MDWGLIEASHEHKDHWEININANLHCVLLNLSKLPYIAERVKAFYYSDLKIFRPVILYMR